MKTLLVRAACVALVTLLASISVSPVSGQAEKVKQKAKDVKKQVEGGQTNKPPQTPPQPKPAK